MVSKIKTQLYDLITGLGYKVADNRKYNENLPWVLIRTGGHNRTDTYDLRYDMITILVDIFSGYDGEKEILEIVENITDNIQSLREANSAIMYIEQKTCKILDDGKTGPVRKHGVISYSFLCASGREDREVVE